jgi:hypothetical protein
MAGPFPRRPAAGQTKDPRHPARVPSVFGGPAASAASVPPSSSVLPPGAGNKAEKAVQPKEERAKKPDERYVDETLAFDRNLDAPTVRRHGDDDALAIPTFEVTQSGLRH